MNSEKKEGDQLILEERVYNVHGSFRVRGALVNRQTRKRLARGRRQKNKIAPDSGRYVRSRIPCGRVRNLAVDATLRAAAPHQLHRRHLGLAPEGGIRVLSCDLREKVLARSSGVSLLFAVDASGSMGAEEVMARAKGLVLSLLADAYQKRDRVGLLAFRGTEARVVLPFTNSVEQAQRRLRGLPTGGKSPLALALARCVEVIDQEGRRNPGRTPLLVLLTDGKANISMAGGEPFEEALAQARRLRVLRVRSLVVDTDPTWIHSFAYPRAIAEAMGGQCLSLASLELNRIIDFVNLGEGVP